MNVRAVLLFSSLALLLAGCGGSSSSGIVNVRTVNFVRGSSSVSVTAQTTLLGSGLVYGNPTSYTVLTNYPQDITATDTTSSTTLGMLTLSAAGGDFYTLYVYGVENGSPSSTVELLQDVQPAVSVVTTDIRVGNFSTTVPGGANVDVYITPTTTQSLTGLTPQFSNVSFGTVETYQQMGGNAYTVWVTPTGVPTQVLNHVNQQFNNAAAYSVYVDDQSTAGTQPFLDIVTDTF